MTPLMMAWCLEGRHVLVVGGGRVARDRVASLADTGARVTVVAPVVGPELRSAVSEGRVAWQPRVWSAALQLELAPDLVLAAVDDAEVSAAIARTSRAHRVPVNVADQPEHCDFWFAAVHREGALQVAVSTAGAGPALAGRLRRELAASLPGSVGRALTRFGALRRAVRAADPAPSASARRMGWLTRLGRGRSWGALAQLDVRTEVARYRRGDHAVVGRVTLVGAGPGDPRLLTIAARNALSSADLVLCDRLVPPAVRALAPAELRVAGKVPGRADAAQAELMRWMLEGARAGRHVVRLKCGDPFLFGRGAEERDALEAHGVPVEVVPGVSSALAAPLLAGISATERGVADRVVVCTGRGAGGVEVAPPAYCPHTTAVFLMSVGRLASLVAALRAAGWPAACPAAAVERASHPDQRVMRASLAELPSVAAARRLEAPAVIVVGQVAAEGVAATLAAAG